MLSTPTYHSILESPKLRIIGCKVQRLNSGAPPPCSWTFQESEVEGCEYQDDSYVHHQPFPEPVLEEQDIDRDDYGCHQDYVECADRLASHFSPRLTVRRSSGCLTLFIWIGVNIPNAKDYCSKSTIKRKN